MTTVTQVKCACPRCECIVSLSDAVMKDDEAYCCEACANGHPNGEGCQHAGCGCNS